jgi:hypothetical protein
MVTAIVIAGLAVGVTTYIDCGSYTSCRGIAAEDRVACFDWENLTSTPPTQAQCASAGCCYDETFTNETFVNSSAWSVPGLVCFVKGPMPECWYSDDADTLAEFLLRVEHIVLMVFTAEVLLKVLAEKLHPWKYFEKGQNVFDFIVVLACYAPGGDQIAVLRLMRLLRLLKLLNFVPKLQIILKGLENGLESINYVMVGCP